MISIFVKAKNKDMNKYVKVKGHSNWFMLLDKQEPVGLSEKMQTKLFRSQVSKIHDKEDVRGDLMFRIKLAAARNINYTDLVNKYGAILIRPIGSYMSLQGNEILEEVEGVDFPIVEYSSILICENDENADSEWINYLEGRFPEQELTTLKFFDLMSEDEVKRYFNKSEYITFSTTFTNYDWFKKLSRLSNDSHKIIGYCYDIERWQDAICINPNVEIIKSLKQWT